MQLRRFVKTVCYDAGMNPTSTFSAARRARLRRALAGGCGAGVGAHQGAACVPPPIADAVERACFREGARWGRSGVEESAASREPGRRRDARRSSTSSGPLALPGAVVRADRSSGRFPDSRKSAAQKALHFVPKFPTRASGALAIRQARRPALRRERLGKKRYISSRNCSPQASKRRCWEAQAGRLGFAETVQSFPKVSRFDHLPSKNHAYSFHKSHKSESARSRSGGPTGEKRYNSSRNCSFSFRPASGREVQRHRLVSRNTLRLTRPAPRLEAPRDRPGFAKTVQSFPNVSRFDHLTAENRVSAFHKLHKSEPGVRSGFRRSCGAGARVASARTVPLLAPARPLPRLRSALAAW